MAQPSFHGRFIWHELLCTDVSAAAAFYTRILPWKAQPFSPGSPYWIFKTQDGRSVAGAMRLSDEARSAGTGAHWRGYIGAADVDAIAGQAVGLGARIQQPVQDVPGVGRVALLTDPEGAIFGLFCPAEGSINAPAATPSFTWNELAVRNREAGLAFYQRLFGWQLRTPMDMGGGFQYQTFGQDQDFGGAYTIPADRAMPPSWCTYAASSSADDTARKVVAAGGQLVHGPTDVPGGGRIVQFFDAQRALFAVHSMAVAASAAPGKAKPKVAAKSAPPAAKKAAKKVAKKSPKKAKSRIKAKAKKKAARRRTKRLVRRAVRKVRRVVRRVKRAKRKIARKRARPAKRKAARKK
jgi:uncharacterized protein